MEQILDNFLKLISQTIVEQNNQIRNQNENEINAIIYQPEILQHLLHKICTTTIKPEILSYIFVLLRKIANDVQNMKEEQTIFFINNIVNCVYSLNVSFKNKLKFISILKLAISPPSFSNDDNTIKKMRKNIIENLIAQKLEFKDVNQIQLISSPLLIAYSLFVSSTSTPNFNSIYIELNNWLEEYYNQIIDKIIIHLESLEFTTNKLKQNTVTYQLVKSYLKILTQYAKLLKYIIKRLKKLALGKIEQLAANLKFLTNMQNILFLKIGNTTVDNANIIFDLTEFPVLNEKINYLKRSLISSLKNLLVVFITNKKKMENEKEKLILFYKSVLKTLIEALYNFYTKSNLTPEKLNAKNELYFLIYYTLIFILRSSTENSFFEIFSKVKKPLIIHVLYFNMILSSEERLNFEDNPNEFDEYTKDIVSSKTSKTIKVVTSKLISILSDRIDGVIAFITYSLLDLNYYNVKQLNPEIQSPQINLDILTELANCYFISKCDVFTILENSLLILNVIVSDFTTREDLKHKMKEFIKFLQPYVNSFSDLLKSRFFYLVTFFLQCISLTKKKQELEEAKVMKENYFKMLIDELKGDNTLSLLVLSNIEILIKENMNKKIFFEKFGINFLVRITDIIFDSYSNNTIKLLYLFVESTWELFNDHPDLIEKTLEVLTKKILKEQQEKNEDFTIRINNCWKILIKISEQESLAINFNRIFYEKIESLILFAKSHFDINWQENLLETYDNIYKFTKILPPNHIEVFELLMHIYDTSGYKISEIKSLLNTFLRYNPEIFDDNKKSVMFFIFEKSLKDSQLYHSTQYAIIDTILLFQIFIQQLGNIFNIAEIEMCLSFYSFLKNKYCIEINEEEKCEYMVEKIEGLYLSLLISCTNYIIKEPQELYLNNIKYIISIAHLFETNYERKLLCFAFINCVKTLFEKRNNNFHEICVYILNFLIMFMKFFENLEMVLFASKKGNETNNTYTEREQGFFNIKSQLESLLFNKTDLWFDHLCNETNFYNNNNKQFLDESISVEDIINCGDPVANFHEEKKLFVKDLLSAIDQRDEYIYLKRILANMRRINSTLFDTLIMSLDETAKFYFKDVVFRVFYVNVNDNKKELRKIVKIIKPN